MRIIYSLVGFALLLWSFPSNAQTFTNATQQLPSSFNSGGCVGVTDMDGNGYDDIIVLHNSRHLRVMYQTADGFSLEDYGTVSGNNQWGFAIGDIAGDGHRDVISGGAYDGVHFVQITEPGQSSMTNLSNGNMFMQDCNVVDIDNDGQLDYFACHDDALSRMWRNDGNGNLVPANDLIDLTNYDTGDFPNTDHSGNYGSVWSDIDGDGDLDLIIAKCRQFVSNPQDPRRINQAWINDGNGNYTEEALDRGLVLYHQSWTVDFADVNNNGHMDCLLTNHSTTLRLLLNDGNGFFTDVTAAAGLQESGFFLQAKMVDFDNDGFVDIIYAGGVHKFFRNNGDGTFSHVPSTFPYSDTMHSFGIGDLNRDGFLDVYASYGNSYVSPDSNNPDILWLNDGNDNNWVVFDLEGTESNIDAVGAKVKIYGDWGVQVREVRAGESYGIVNTFHMHFGLGQSESIDQVVIDWPSGIQTVIENPEINTFHSIIEASCVINDISIQAQGELTICEGEQVELIAPAGYQYNWSNGETTETIQVSESGLYEVIVTDNEGCLGVSNEIEVVVLQIEAPAITAEGELTFCSGESVTLTSTEGQTYTWSTGADTQSIEVTSSGVYSVAVSDQCSTDLMSESIEVEVLSATPPQATSPLNVEASNDADITVSGNSVAWYESELANDAFAFGNSITVNIEETTSFWVESTTTFGEQLGNGGKETTTADGGQYHTNSSFWLVFDAATDIILESVKVFAGSTANRTIALIDADGNTLESLTVNIPEGEQTVELNFSVPEGSGYGLRSVGGSPLLWRDGPPAPLSFPYDLGGLATITGTSIVGTNSLAYYYFFYDWKVNTPSTTCVSDRVEIVVTLGDPGTCIGDFDNDGFITTNDLLIFLANFGCVENCETDLDGDGIVGSSDLLVFLSVYGTPCN